MSKQVCIHCTSLKDEKEFEYVRDKSGRRSLICKKCKKEMKEYNKL